LFDRAAGKVEGIAATIRIKEDDRRQTAAAVQKKIPPLCQFVPSTIMKGISAAFNEDQKREASEAAELIRVLVKTNHDVELLLADYITANKDLETISGKMKGLPGRDGDAESGAVKAAGNEFTVVRQMAKMTIGRQGNAFPILSGEYFRPVPQSLGSRENVLAILSWIESIDEEVFCRIFKNKTIRIFPNVILLPTYGDFGICWEPYEKHNKASSRGLAAVPMYAKNLVIAVLSAVADLRWQTAKEQSSYYWMEEGLTGSYYQWWTGQKFKGDVKLYFIQDYILWITKEAEGVQKLDKTVRTAFWRYMPFAQPLKEALKKRNPVYEELYQRDINRKISAS
jgi:hypothetical protein